MSVSTPLSRQQLSNLQIARGIPASEIQQRTGMPRASYEAMFNSDAAEEKELAKLVSRTTFERLTALLGISGDFTGLRSSGVLEWRAEGTDKKTASRWTEAVAALLKERFTDKLMLTQISVRSTGGAFARFFRKQEQMVLIYDRVLGLRIAITRAPADLLGQIEKMAGITCQRRKELSQREFNDTREMIRHEVLRSVQFDSMTGIVAPTYTWLDVQAAAREFGFHTDDLVNMMHEAAARRGAQLEEQEAAQPEAEAPESEMHSERHNTDFQVMRLRVVNAA